MILTGKWGTGASRYYKSNERALEKRKMVYKCDRCTKAAQENVYHFVSSNKTTVD